MSNEQQTADLVISQCRAALQVAQRSMLAIIHLFPDADVPRHTLKHFDKAIKAIDDLRAATETSDDYGELKGGTAGISEALNRLSLAMGDPCLSWEDGVACGATLIDEAVRRISQQTNESQLLHDVIRDMRVENRLHGHITDASSNDSILRAVNNFAREIIRLTESPKDKPWCEECQGEHWPNDPSYHRTAVPPLDNHIADVGKMVKAESGYRELEDSAREVVDAYQRRFCGTDGRLYGPIDEYVEVLIKSLGKSEV